jgi:hypothetical protein
MASLNIRVGASVDRSLAVAFRPLVEGAKRARTAIEAESKRSGRAIATEAKKGTKDAEARFRELEHEIMTGIPKATTIASEAVHHFAQEAKTSFANVKRSFADLARDAERSLDKIDKKQKAVAGKSFGARAFEASGGMKGVGAGFSRAGRLGMSVGRAGAHAAYGLAMDVAHGMGVETDLGGIFHKNTELEAGATALSNASVIKGDKRNAGRVDPKELMAQVIDTSKKTGTDANTTLEGLRKFVDLTGDLALGREILQDLEMLAKATGTSMEDMVASGGELSLALGDTDHKAEKIVHLMKQFAGQGEMGAISIRALSKSMARVASSAGQFEGDRSKNIAFLGVIGQEARRGGGAASPAQAATAVAGFVNTLKTPARAKAFQKATGKSIFNEKTGMMRNPEDLLMEALHSTGMKPLEFKKIFSSVKGAQGPENLATIYRTAGGGDAGAAAVTAELARLKNAIVDDEQILRSFNAAMATSESQANVFNNSMRETAMKLQQNLMPAAMDLAPVLLDLATKGANVISWMVGHEGRLKREAAGSKAGTEAAIIDTERQIAKGEILDGQRTINKDAETAAKHVLDQSQGDAEIARKQHGDVWDTTLRAGRRLGDFTPGNIVANWMGAKSGAAWNREDEKKLDDKDVLAKEAKVEWDKIHELNQRVANLLENHVIQVKVVAPIPAAAKPPGVDPNGRQDSPEEKAEH